MSRRVLIAVLLLVSLLFMAQVTFAQTTTQSRTYTVRAGDTLRAIAARYNVELQALATTNNIQNINRIFVGQVLTIPATGGPVTPGVSYTVQRGDSLSRIAQRYNVTLDSLVTLNNITVNSTIFPGQVLVIPATGGPTTPTTPTTPTPTPTTPTAPVRRVVNGYYTVQVGDTLSQIARAFGVDMYNIARANGILNLNQIFSGTALRIPGR
ncbi:MAG: hypothetical protein OHK0046_32950 [Anaerolineae bacterium]